ncbi:hypothetical protein ACN47E_005191 [Coniothyrium glycines]
MASAPHPLSRDHPSLDKLKRDFSDDAPLLNSLPSECVSVQEQTELEGVDLHRILYGEMMDEKDQLWTYFTQVMPSMSDAEELLSLYTLNAAQSDGIHTCMYRNQNLALASLIFMQARNLHVVLAIAKHYSMLLCIATLLHWPLAVQSSRNDLL